MTLRPSPDVHSDLVVTAAHQAAAAVRALSDTIGTGTPIQRDDLVATSAALQSVVEMLPDVLHRFARNVDHVDDQRNDDGEITPEPETSLLVTDFDEAAHKVADAALQIGAAHQALGSWTKDSS